MRKIISSFLLALLISGCSTMSHKAPADDDSVEIITLPKSNKNSEVQNMKDARKNLIKIGSQGSTRFDFYYNDSGGYYIVPVSTSDRPLNLSLYDATLVVDERGEEPEYLALAVENNQILSGFGIKRYSKTQFKLIMSSSDASLAQSFNFTFSADIGK